MSEIAAAPVFDTPRERETFLAAYQDAYYHAATIVSPTVPSDVVAESEQRIMALRRSRNTTVRDAVTAARDDLLGIYAGMEGDEAGEVSESLAAQFAPLNEVIELVDARREHLRKARNGFAAAAAGLAGFAATAACIKYDPRVATTFLEHTERFAVVTEAAFIGWGSVAATLFGGAHGVNQLMDRRQERREFRAKRSLARAGIVQTESGELSLE